MSAYAHRLVSIVGNSATIVNMNRENVNIEYLGLENMSETIIELLENAKLNWLKIKANIKLDLKAIMSQGKDKTTMQVLKTLMNNLQPKFNWLSLGILVFSNKKPK